MRGMMPSNNSNDPKRLKEIADLLGQNLSQAEVGRRLGLSRARVGQIVTAHRLSTHTERGKPLLSKRQYCILAFIRDFEVDNPYPPTVRQVAEGCDLKSTGTAASNLSHLAEMGYVRRVPGIARGLLLTDLGRSQTVERGSERVRM